MFASLATLQYILLTRYACVYVCIVFVFGIVAFISMYLPLRKEVFSLNPVTFVQWALFYVMYGRIFMKRVSTVTQSYIHLLTRRMHAYVRQE